MELESSSGAFLFDKHRLFFVALHFRHTRAKCNTRFPWFLSCSCIILFQLRLHIPSSADALSILSDAASLSVAPSNQSSSRIRLPKLPAHISPWEQQQWVPKMQLLIAPRHRYHSPLCCWAGFHTGRDNSSSICSIYTTLKWPDGWTWNDSAATIWLTERFRGNLKRVVSYVSFCLHFQSGAFQGVEIDAHSMWPEMRGSCGELANKKTNLAPF